MTWQAASSWVLSFDNLSDKSCILDEVECDGLPLIHGILASVSKKSVNTVLLSFERPLCDFISVGRRLGHDLSLAVIQKKFFAIDTFTTGKDLTLDLSDKPMIILQAILRFLSMAKAKSSSPLFIIIDGVSILVSLGWKVPEVMNLIIAIESIADRICTRMNKNTSGGIILSKWLAHRSETVISVQKLSSGTSRSAHGEILTLNKSRSSTTTSTFSNAATSSATTSALFKCSESTIMIQLKNTENLINL